MCTLHTVRVTTPGDKAPEPQLHSHTPPAAFRHPPPAAHVCPITLPGHGRVVATPGSIPALSTLPESVRDPPEQFPRHWPLDFVATALTGGTLLLFGFRPATGLTTDR